MPRSHPAVLRATHPPVRHPDRSRRDGPALCARAPTIWRSSGQSGARAIGLGFAVQLCALRHPGRVLDPAESPPAADARLRRAAARRRSGAVRRLRAPGPDPPRARRRTAKLSAPAELRPGRLARLPSGRRGRGVGHGSRRTHRPGDARPSADERRLASAGGGAGADRAGRPCARAKEDLRGARGRADRRRAGCARRGCSRSIRNCADPASPGCGIIRSRPRPPTSSRCWIGSNTRAGWESTPRAPDASMPPASPG